MTTTTRRRWKRGTWMQLKSRELLRAFVGDPRTDPSKKMSGRRLARYADVHPSFIDHLLTGRRRSCTPKTAELIAEALGVPVTVLFDPRTSSITQDGTKSREAVAA